jgi:hypothetical protein
LNAGGDSPSAFTASLSAAMRSISGIAKPSSWRAANRNDGASPTRPPRFADADAVLLHRHLEARDALLGNVGDVLDVCPGRRRFRRSP